MYFLAKVTNLVSLEINCIDVLQYSSYELWKTIPYIILDKEMFRKDLTYTIENAVFLHLFYQHTLGLILTVVLTHS